MAKRKNTVRVLTDDLQGEGSYVVLRRLPYRLVQDARRKMNEAKLSAKENPLQAEVTTAKVEDEFVQEILTQVVVEWDWVDDNDKALEIPSKGLDIGELTVDEITFLMEQATGQGAPAKNSG